MGRQDLSVVGGFYKDPNLHWSAQDVLNWIPVPAEKVGTRTRFQFRDAPGLKPFVRITKQVPDGEGFVTVDQGPVRGMRNVEGKLFVVAGTTLYQISNTGVAIPYGTIPGVGRVSMAHNERGNGNQLLIVNGSSGYVLDTVSLVFQKIVDPGYPGAFIADFCDGYLAQVEPQGRFWFHSDLSQALDYNTFDQYEAEADPDRIVSLHVAFREVLIFGADTIQPFVNTGAAQGTFQPAANTLIQCGCSAKFSPRTMDNATFFLDDQRIVRRLQAYNPIRVSTVGIEAALGECTREEIASAWGTTFEDRGHKVYYLTVPGRFTFGYDVLSGEWHRRGSPGRGSWRLSEVVFWNGKWIGGDFQSGRLYELDWKYSMDACEELERERVTGVLSADQNELTINEMELLFNNGGPASTCALFPDQPEGPTIMGNAPDGAVGVPYVGYAYALGGGSGSYLVTMRSGTFPPGLGSVSPAGVIGTDDPTTLGGYTFTLRNTDTVTGLYSELTDTIEIRVVDPYWDYVISLLHLQGDVGSNDYTDERGVIWDYPNIGTDPLDCAISDDVSFLDAQTTSLEFTPTAGPLKPQIRSEEYGVGFYDGDFTVEFRVNFKSTSGIMSLWHANDASPYDLAIQNNDGVWRVYGVGTATAHISGGTIATGTDYAVALVRSGSTLRLFIDGVSLGTAAFANFTVGADTLHIYGHDPSATDADFYLGEARITKTICRYTANYTPALLPFPNEGP